MAPSFLVADSVRSFFLTQPGRFGRRIWIPGLRIHELRGVFREGRRTEVIFDMNKRVRFGRETLAVRQRRVAAVGEDEGEENCSLHA